MADDTIDSGLFAISLSDSDDEAPAQSNADRTGQTEGAFQAVKASYRAKVENGEIWRGLQVPLGQRKVSKHEGQELLHAVEELYFYRRYDEAVSFIAKALQGDGGGAGLEGDVRDLLGAYEKKCLAKLGRSTA